MEGQAEPRRAYKYLYRRVGRKDVQLVSLFLRPEIMTLEDLRI